MCVCVPCSTCVVQTTGRSALSALSTRVGGPDDRQLPSGMEDTPSGAKGSILALLASGSLGLWA